MVMTNEATEQEWLLIGKIVGAHGLNGHVKVFAESDFPKRFTKAGDRWLQKPNGEPEKVRITSGRFLDGKNQYLVKLEGVDYRDQAEDLRQAQLMVPASDRLALEPGEFHVSDLIGSTVIIQSDQSVLGTVTDVFTTGHDMLEVLLADQGVVEGITEPVNTKKASETSAEIEHPSTRAKAVKKLKLQAKRKRKKKAPKTLLIPFVEEIVPIVDTASGRIEVTPPSGLLDL